MLPAIQLDDLTTLKAYEIDDVSTDRSLPAEPATGLLPLTQVMPQAPLGLGHVESELPGEVAAHPLPPTPALPRKGGGRKMARS
jgi:hypothetical protein